MNTIRAFIAIRLPAPVERALGEVAQTLALRTPRGAMRWVRPEQIHLTLRFLGDTATSRVDAIGAAMDALATDTAPLALHLDGIGCFPNARRPRVIWVRLAGDEARLAELKAALDERLAGLGFPPDDKPFRAHLTLGRIKDDRAAQGVDWTVDVPPLAVPVAMIYLMESQLRPEGPIYTVRHMSELRG